jgi:hypothetical protein
LIAFLFSGSFFFGSSFGDCFCLVSSFGVSFFVSYFLGASVGAVIFLTSYFG